MLYVYLKRVYLDSAVRESDSPCPASATLGKASRVRKEGNFSRGLGHSEIRDVPREVSLSTELITEFMAQSYCSPLPFPKLYP